MSARIPIRKKAVPIEAKYALRKPANRNPVNFPVSKKCTKNNPPNTADGTKFMKARNQKNRKGY